MATTTAEKTPKTTSAADLTPEQALRRRAGRTIGRGVWLAGFQEEYPDATREDTQKAWGEVRADFTKIGMRALKTLERGGFRVVEAPENKSDDESGDD